MSGSVTINGRQIKRSAIAALKPYDEGLLDPYNVTHRAELHVWVSVYNGRPVHARRSLKQLADELGFPMFQSQHAISQLPYDVALNPHFGHYKIEAHNPQRDPQIPTIQSVISWRSQYGERRIPLCHSVEDVISQLPKLAQRMEASATRPHFAAFKAARAKDLKAGD